jgi:hypothetical protein
MSGRYRFGDLGCGVMKPIHLVLCDAVRLPAKEPIHSRSARQAFDHIRQLLTHAQWCGRKVRMLARRCR